MLTTNKESASRRRRKFENDFLLIQKKAKKNYGLKRTKKGLQKHDTPRADKRYYV